MSIVFFGASQMGLRCCEALLEADVPVSAVVSTLPHYEVKGRRVENSTWADFGRLGLPLILASAGKDETVVQAVSELKPDLGVAVGWYFLLPGPLREQFKLGVVGLHNGPLPRYRGGSPLVWTLLNGEPSATVSLFYLEEGIDTGDIVAQQTFRLEATEAIGSATERATEIGKQLLVEYVPAIMDGSAPRIPQDHSQATYYPPRAPEDGRIDWALSAEEVERCIRAQSRPYPGAWTEIHGKKLTILDANVEDL